MSTKRVDVATILTRANTLLASGYGDAQYRLGVCSLMEQILHESGNYVGFGYIDTPYVAGVTDESRRSYYFSHRLSGDETRYSRRAERKAADHVDGYDRDDLGESGDY